jgi:hypothetical protein
MILSALRMIGEKPPGGTLTTAEQTDYLYDLNAAMESWGLDRSMCYQLLEESFALTTSVGSYTIGPSGAFQTARPTKIVDPCFTRDSSDIDHGIEICNAQAYGGIAAKTTGTSFPEYLYYDAAFVAGNATIFMFPEPSASLTLHINSYKQLPTFAAIGAALMLPPGYQLAIESNFAVMKAGGFTRASPELVKTARDSMARVKAVNVAANSGVLRLDAGVVQRGGRWDINTGD